jgi:hypothetical protein
MQEKTGYLAFRWRDPVDVVVMPLGPTSDTWTLTDRLRRRLGHIREFPNTGFRIFPDEASALYGVKPGPHTSLAAAMEMIESHTKGVCQLSSGDDDPPGRS